MTKRIKPKAPPVFLFNFVMKFTNFLKKLRFKILPPQAMLIEYSIEYVVLHRCVYAVVELFIPDLLQNGPQHVEYLAKKSGMNPDALYRVMRTLTGIGIFKEKKDRVFENSKMSDCLIYGREGSMAALTKFAASPWVSDLWTNFYHSIEHCKDLCEIKHGKGFFDWIQDQHEEYRVFDEGMTGLSSLSDEPVAAVYNFSKANSIVDVGGGHGRQLAVILKANPHLKGILFDMPRVIEAARIEKTLAQDPLLKDRVELVEGSFFDKIPAGHDIYFMKSIMHDWYFEEANKILKNIRKVMHENSKLLVVDMIVKGDNEPDFSKILDVGMLGLLGGQERSKEQFEQLFEKSGFKLTRIISTASPYKIVEGVLD